MSNVVENIRTVEELESLVKAHPMCARFEKKEDRYLVTYPSGFSHDAAQARWTRLFRKEYCLRRLLEVMEKEWALWC